MRDCLALRASSNGPRYRGCQYFHRLCRLFAGVLHALRRSLYSNNCTSLLLLIVQSTKPLLRRLQPISLVILFAPLDNMKCINEPTPPTPILLALVQQVPVNQDQRPGFDLAQRVRLLFPDRDLLLDLEILRVARPIHADFRELHPAPVGFAYEPAVDGRAPMRTFRETQAPVFGRRVLERDPEPHRAGRVRVQEGAVLMRFHPAPDLRLLADDHALQHPRIFETEAPRYGRVAWSQGRVPEGGVEFVQVVPDLVDGAMFGLEELVGGRVEGVFFEEKADFVAGGEEVIVADVGGAVFVVVVGVAGGEFGHGVGREGEVGEEGLGFAEEGGGG